MRTVTRTMTKNKMKHTKSILAWSLILLMGCALLSGCGKKDATPNPGLVQVVNPMMAVSSAEEMESYLDFTVPVLDKEVADYIVLVFNGYPTMGRIYYADDSVFSIQYGTGDISGIYGGTLEKTEPVNGVKVSYYTYEAIRYAMWENGGFTYSLTGGVDLEDEIETLIP